MKKLLQKNLYRKLVKPNSIFGFKPEVILVGLTLKACLCGDTGTFVQLAPLETSGFHLYVAQRSVWLGYTFLG